VNNQLITGTPLSQLGRSAGLGDLPGAGEWHVTREEDPYLDDVILKKRGITGRHWRFGELGKENSPSNTNQKVSNGCGGEGRKQRKCLGAAKKENPIPVISSQLNPSGRCGGFGSHSSLCLTGGDGGTFK